MEKLLSQFFNGKNIGKNLKEMAVDLIKTDTASIVSRWYHGPSTDLFTWTDKKSNIIKQQLHFNGQVVEWNCLDGIKTGLVLEADLGLKPTYTKEGTLDKDRVSQTIQYDQKAMFNCVELALEILEHTEFEMPVRFQLISNFKDPQNINTMDPKLFINRFGSAVPQHQGLFDGIRDQLKKLIK